MVSLKDVLLLGIFPAVMSVGQILFRESAVGQAGKGLKEAVIGLSTSPTFYIAVTFYVFATGFWLWLLSKYPLSIAYPIAMLAVVFTPLIDTIVFKCQLSGMYWVGLAIMLIGVFIIVRSGPGVSGAV